jgi:hypothetical protein
MVGMNKDYTTGGGAGVAESCTGIRRDDFIGK